VSSLSDSSAGFPDVEIVRDGSSPSARRWLKRRIVFVIPALLLVSVQLSNLFYTANPYIVYLVPFVALLVILLFGGVLIKDAWVRSHAAPEVLWTSTGQFRVDQLRGAQFIGRMLAPVRDSYRGSRGWVTGNLAVTTEGIDFSPGHLARSEGVQAAHIPWVALSKIRMISERLSFGMGIELYMSDGNAVDCEVRDGPRLGRVLENMRQQLIQS
jgi:hypothetical protein